MSKTAKGSGEATGAESFGPSRRAIIRLAAMAVGATVGRAWAQPYGLGDAIDVHHHYFPPIAKKLYGPFPPLQTYTAAKSLEAMNGAGVEFACLSLPAQLAKDVSAAEASVFAREVNEHGKQIELEHGGRFRLFGFLPFAPRRCESE